MEKEERLKRMKEKSETMGERKKKIDAGIKELEKSITRDKRKHRTHMLIELGATICSVYSKDYLETEDIKRLYAFLKDTRDTGKFTIADVNTGKHEQEKTAWDDFTSMETKEQKTNDDFYAAFGF